MAMHFQLQPGDPAICGTTGFLPRTTLQFDDVTCKRCLRLGRLGCTRPAKAYKIRLPKRYAVRFSLADGSVREFRVSEWNKLDAAAAGTNVAREALGDDAFKGAWLHGAEEVR